MLKMIDYIIIGLVVLGVIAVIFFRIRSSKKNKGSGCDGNCSSCGTHKK